MSFPSSPDFENKTLVLPAVSFGNVGQLAVDILLSTALSSSDAQHSGHVQSRHLLPVAGSDPFGILPSPGAIATPCELYTCPRANAVIMQRRSMCAKGRSNNFAVEIATWCKEQKFSQVVILAGADSGSLRDRSMHAALQQGLIHFVASSSVKDELDYGSWQRFTQQERDPNGDLLVASASDSGTLPSNIHKGGLSKRLFAACESVEMPIISLVCFISEGYNVPDGVRMATSLCEHLPGLTPKGMNESEPGKWIIPSSWNSLAPTAPVEADMFY